MSDVVLPSPRADHPTRDPSPYGTGALAGAVAAAAALGAGELVSSVSGADHSLVTSVGTSFIDRFAGPLKEPAIAIFGSNDKAALIIGIVALSLALGAVAGQQRVRRPWMPWVLFGGFGAIGASIGVFDPLASAPFVVAGAVVAAAVGLGTLHLLATVAAGGGHHLAGASASHPSGSDLSGSDASGTPSTSPARFEDPRRPASSRRAFFGWAGAGAGFAALTATGSRRLGSGSDVERARQSVVLPAPKAPAGTTTTLERVAGPGGAMVEGLTPYIVPNDRFYRIDTALVSPNVDVATWSLSITGLVDRPFTLSFDELVAMADVEETVTIACVSNEVGDTLVGNARWQGVPLRTLLDRAGVQAGAGQVVGLSVDGFTAGFPIETLDGDRVALVAVAMNGEPLPVQHGFPARLIVSGLYGYVSATKWLSEIRLTTWEGFDGYWMPRGWSKLGPVKTQSRIDVPRRSSTIRPGPTPIAGVAWAPTKGIAKVEVQVDDGPWQEARLGDTVSNNTWCQWVLTWDAPEGDHKIRVRATDGTGETQTEEETSVIPDGATGWHTISVSVEP